MQNSISDENKTKITSERDHYPGLLQL